MDIKECYKEMGADYEDVLRRMGSDSLVERFTLRFLDDKSYQMIKGSEASQAAVDREYQRTENAIRRWQNENRG